MTSGCIIIVTVAKHWRTHQGVRANNPLNQVDIQCTGPQESRKKSADCIPRLTNSPLGQILKERIIAHFKEGLGK